jgi:hypothetical protein
MIFVYFSNRITQKKNILIMIVLKNINKKSTNIIFEHRIELY